MTQQTTPLTFTTLLLQPAKPTDQTQWAFVVLPKAVSESLSRRGRLTVAARINGHPFKAKLEPDGKLSHWCVITDALMTASGANIGERVEVEITPLENEPEPEVPDDLREALNSSQHALTVWQQTTTLARVDWIHWIVSAKQTKTRHKRINDACDMLASGKKRVCCFDPSGFYSKALSAPKAAD